MYVYFGTYIVFVCLDGCLTSLAKLQQIVLPSNQQRCAFSIHS